jgi:type 2A phosphatase activator TIP41
LSIRFVFALRKRYVLIRICALIQVSETTERIDIEKLKQREQIHFYDNIMLFEDELSDNGTSVLNVKIVRL